MELLVLMLDHNMQGETISEAGTMTGGGSKPRGGRMCIGSAAPRSIDARAAAAELAQEEKSLAQAQQVCLAAVTVVII